MTIWIDADAAPREVKEIVFRAGKRLAIEVVLVANRKLDIPPAYPNARSVAVTLRADAADHWIEANARPGDLVVTADVALAAALVTKPAGTPPITVLDPRGSEYTADNAACALSIRDFMENLRGAGVKTQGPRPYDPRDSQAFAAALDRALTRRGKNRRPSATE